MAIVVNRRVEEFDVYIARGSRWGNDYSHVEVTQAKFVVGSRDEAIEMYRRQLWAKLNSGEGWTLLKDLAALNGKRLGCYCKPLACHGDVLVAAAAWAQRELDLDAGREIDASW